jgi:Icc-related predicted phosphoesterase
VRFAYVVDVHGRPRAVSDVVGGIGEIDVLIVGGDLTTDGMPDEAERAIESWRPLAPRLLAVAGNMDSREIDARLAELGVALDGRGVVFDGVGVFGVSAAPLSPLRTPYELSDEELEERIGRGFAEVESCRVRVFCPHAPPAGTACDRLVSGEHVGSAVIRAFVERAQPDLVLCGHIHEARATDTIGRSRIANPGPVSAGHYALVEIDGEAEVRLDE